jgi:hypothetical protein
MGGSRIGNGEVPADKDEPSGMIVTGGARRVCNADVTGRPGKSPANRRHCGISSQSVLKISRTMRRTSLDFEVGVCDLGS